MKQKLLIFLLTIFGLASCLNSMDKKSDDKQLAEPNSYAGQNYEVTIRENQNDSTFIINCAHTTEKYLTELWVSDPECTECKDCFVDSGEIKIPVELVKYIDKQWLKDLYLSCNDPYKIEKEAYIKYVIKGYVSGSKWGHPLFCVKEWKRR